MTLVAVGALVGAVTGMAQAAPHRSPVLYQRPATMQGNGPRLLCDEGNPVCAETAESIGYEGSYTGHDEPSLLFYSDRAGSGNSTLYRLTIPGEPKRPPQQDGGGGTYNFQLHPAFWFGMALCDNQSAPEFTHDACAPSSDANIFDGNDPSQPDYVGYHPGTAFLELQFYPPGWAPWPPGVSCDATQWCAAMAIFSLNEDQNTLTVNNESCLDTVGLEPANFAFITFSGAPHDDPSPLGLTTESFTPDPATDLFMKSGDQIDVSIHDSADGLVTEVNDLSSGRSGSMTASSANGFAQINYEPDAASCSQSPYSFHPMYSTSSEHTRVPWAAHSYNVAFSDEIGHFEFCDAITGEGGDCTASSEGVDDDDTNCYSADFSTRIPVTGCIGTDTDFDGSSYQTAWPGSFRNNGRDRLLHPRSILFTSPLFNGSENFDRVAFEADLPRIEASDFGGICDRNTGENCVNPPPGANFYPIYSTTKDGKLGCLWQLGGPNIPGTKNTFGGNSTAEYGDLLLLTYPGAGFTPVTRYNDFRQVLSNNPCERK